jgi:AsmA protein
MNRILLHPISLICALAFLLVSGWLYLMPSQIAKKVKLGIEDRTGRALLVGGGSSLTFSPKLGVALYDISLAGSSALAEPVVHAKELWVPISFGQLLTGQGSPASLTIDGADIVVALNSTGHANVLIELDPVANKTDAEVLQPRPMHIKVENSTFRFSDLRNSHNHVLQQFSGDFDFGADGQLTAAGGADVNDQHLNYTFSLNSLSRAFAEGSPVDLNVDGVESSFSFSGRVATNESLNLAGQASLESKNLPRLLKWFGAKFENIEEFKTVALSGSFAALDSVFMMKKAQLQLGNMNGEGYITFSNAGERPNLTADLNFDTIDLNRYKSGHSFASNEWSETPIQISNLKAIDAQFHITTNKLVYGPLETGAASIQVSLQSSDLLAKISSDAVAGGKAQIGVSFDAQQLPPSLTLDMSLDKVDAKSFLPALIGQKWLSGPLTLKAQLAANGVSQAAMLSTLSGDIDAQVENGSLNGVALVPLVEAVRSNVVDGWNGNVTTSVNAKANFKLVDGVATVGDNSFTVAGLSFSTIGEVDILRRALALSSAQLQLQAKGPWVSPQISTIETAPE